MDPFVAPLGTFTWAAGSSYTGTFEEEQGPFALPALWRADGYVGFLVEVCVPPTQKFSSTVGREDEIHGVGHYRWADGRTYSGQWQHNCCHGSVALLATRSLGLAGSLLYRLLTPTRSAKSSRMQTGSQNGLLNATTGGCDLQIS